MMLSIIVAMAENNAIGLNNQLPWRIPADLAHFKRTTMGKPIIMGRKTFESIGRPLPGRENIVVTRNSKWQADGVSIRNSLEQALHFLGAENNKEVFLIGGASLYAQVLPLCQKIVLTQIHSSVKGDAFFPEIDYSEWQVQSREDFLADSLNEYPYSFIELHRVSKSL